MRFNVPTRVLGPGALVFAIAIVIAVGVFAAAAFTIARPVVHPLGTVIDEVGLAEIVRRFEPARHDLNAIPSPPNSRAEEPAHVTRCPSDGGEVFEPQLYREWRLTGTARSRDWQTVTPDGTKVADAIVAGLKNRGWQGSGELELAENYPYTSLRRSYRGYTIDLTIQVFDDSVLVGGDTHFRRVCRDSSDEGGTIVTRS